MRVLALASGSTGNSTFLHTPKGGLLIDAGISARRIRMMLREEGIALDAVSAILITHEHTDHIKGLEVLLRQNPVSVYALPKTAKLLRGLYPEHRDLILDTPQEGISFPDAYAAPIATMHDSADSCGWRIESEYGIYGHCTDLGLVTDEVMEGLCGADLALIESNHDIDMLVNGPYPPVLKRRILSEYGHLSNDAAADLAVALCGNGTRSLILGHISKHNNTPGLAYRTVHSALCEALPEPLWPKLAVAPELGPLAVELKVRATCSM